MPSSLFTRVFWQDAATRAVSAGSATAITAWTFGATGVVPSVPGYAVAAAFGSGALLDLLRSLASLRVPNGTASFLPNVVAKPKDDA
ncbi:hypothetical protein A5656_14765 [Mycobacterium gordonae]|nr:hypothetical protein [Mycobacterium gordonae]OBK59266.1 hypothetical protein A5656_14765 [Mycobacterium gordonae]